MDNSNEARKLVESQGSSGFRRAWITLSPADKAVALIGLAMAAAIGALAMALLDREATRQPVPALLELRSSLK